MEKTQPIDQQVCFALYSANNALMRLYRPLLQPFDLTYPQYVILLALWQEDGVTLGQLGGKTLFDSGTLTPLVKKLEQKAWLQREPDPSDERVKRVVLTAKGKKLESEVAGVMQALRCQVDVADETFIALREQAWELQKKIREAEQLNKA